MRISDWSSDVCSSDLIAGKWRFADGALTLDGGLLLTDAAPDPRFFPLVSNDASLRFADGIIEAKAGFNERKTGTKILDTLIRHRLADRSGSADLTVNELRFNEGIGRATGRERVCQFV